MRGICPGSFRLPYPWARLIVCQRHQRGEQEGTHLPTDLLEGLALGIEFDFFQEGGPLSELVGIFGELFGERDGRFRRDAGVSVAESGRNGCLKHLAFKRKSACQEPDIKKVLHSAIHHAESDHGMGFLGDDGFP